MDASAFAVRLSGVRFLTRRGAARVALIAEDKSDTRRAADSRPWPSAPARAELDDLFRARASAREGGAQDAKRAPDRKSGSGERHSAPKRKTNTIQSRGPCAAPSCSGLTRRESWPLSPTD